MTPTESRSIDGLPNLSRVTISGALRRMCTHSTNQELSERSAQVQALKWALSSFQAFSREPYDKDFLMTRALQRWWPDMNSPQAIQFLSGNVKASETIHVPGVFCDTFVRRTIEGEMVAPIRAPHLCRVILRVQGSWSEWSGDKKTGVKITGSIRALCGVGNPHSLQIVNSQENEQAFKVLYSRLRKSEGSEKPLWTL